ncbi:Auxin response factor [Parasponia andersonii]|uniref:Auxin response factor n=1 Tax=Parasponia andersonii TaxID=3476 RepID=A0A2P5BN32_PARAD|nr:Auxin response factor [Parasponia andersonii]
MITVMDSGREPTKKGFEKCLDPQLWHACAGPLVQMPPVNSKVLYFPQGHAEHAQGSVDFGNFRIPSLILCKVSAIRFMADPDTDEVFAKMGLTPLRDNKDLDVEDEGEYLGNNGIVVENPEKPKSFAKTLTQSDANNGGGFSVPRYCAETIFPPLDLTAQPPVQTILAKDVHGETWKFRHIYRGTPRRHLLTTGWSNFVNQKKLVAGDSIVFLRADNGDLCVGIRRAKKGIGCGHEYPSGWNPSVGNYGSQYENRVLGKNGSRDLKGKVRAESVVEAATLAATGQPFEVVYYPRASTPEFCVRAPAVRAAMQIRWCSGLRFKMPFETEDSSRISWFMGTISSVQVASPIHWPDSPWRLLQVAWDEPDLLQNVKRVNPWLVELVSSIPAMHVSPFSTPRKKPRLPQNPDFALVGQIPMPLLSTNFLSSSSPFRSIQDNVPTGIQGARHAQFGPYPSDHLNELQAGLLPLGFQQFDHTNSLRNPVGDYMKRTENRENISCWLKMGHPNQDLKANEDMKTPHLLLFGQVILTEEQLSKSSSGENSSSEGNLDKTTNHSDGSGSTENSSDGGSPWYKDHHNRRSDLLGLETGHCKVFIESDDVGRTLDLSLLGSYQELYGKLADMFGIEEGSGILGNVLYRDAAGCVKHTGDEPFSEFLKTARRLTIHTDSGSDNVGR